MLYLMQSASGAIAGILDGARLSQKRRSQIREVLRDLDNALGREEQARKRAEQREKDALTIARMQEKHIKNLEAQLRPHLLDTGAAG